MTSTADKYISESGRTASYNKDTFTEDLMTAGLFLAWAEEDGAEYGGKSAKEALQAMCRMLDMNPRGLRKALIG